jgi:hypothetical protein
LSSPNAASHPPRRGENSEIGDVFAYFAISAGLTEIATHYFSVALNNAEFGWLYKGSDGKTYIQYNFADQAGYNFGVNAGIISAGTSTPGGYSGIYPYTGSAGGKGSVPAGSLVQTCWQQDNYLGGNYTG